MWVTVACGASAQLPENRVALVIGNSSYSNVSRLPNPSDDATAVAQTLKELGFKTVQAEHDLGFDAMRRVLRDFAAEAEKADWVVVYYAGHGIEVDGSNYLIPVDARLRTDRDVHFEAVALEQVLASIEGARKLRLIILDACRDNPFIRQMKRTVASRSIGRGLARVEPPGGGTLVAYAAKAGQIAFDGAGENSPFVSSLVRRLSEPGVEINKLFRAVRDDVLAETGNKQEPFVYGSLPNEDFYFKPVAALEPNLQVRPVPAGASDVAPLADLPSATDLTTEPIQSVPPSSSVFSRPNPRSPGPGRAQKLIIKQKGPGEITSAPEPKVRAKAPPVRRAEPRPPKVVAVRPIVPRPPRAVVAHPIQGYAGPLVNRGGYPAAAAAPTYSPSLGNDPKDLRGAWGNWYDR